MKGLSGRSPTLAHMAQREWYSDGLRFECTQCGACCTGRPGFVLFSEDEAALITERLGVTPQEFHDTYTHDTPAGRSLAERLAGADVELVENAKVGRIR